MAAKKGAKPELTQAEKDAAKAKRQIEKAAKFKTIGDKRVPAALAKIRVIGNLANTNQYAYTQAQADKIISALVDAVDGVKRAFTAKADPAQSAFEL